MGSTPVEVFEANKDFLEDPMELIKQYQFSLKGIPTTITVRLLRYFGSDKIHFTQSHYIKTPTQIDAYVTSHPYNNDADSALSQVVTGFTRFYSEAVSKGHAPSKDWLVANEYF
jgi:hypothetical protein